MSLHQSHSSRRRPVARMMGTEEEIQPVSMTRRKDVSPPFHACVARSRRRLLFFVCSLLLFLLLHSPSSSLAQSSSSSTGDVSSSTGVSSSADSSSSSAGSSTALSSSTADSSSTAQAPGSTASSGVSGSSGSSERSSTGLLSSTGDSSSSLSGSSSGSFNLSSTADSSAGVSNHSSSTGDSSTGYSSSVDASSSSSTGFNSSSTAESSSSSSSTGSSSSTASSSGDSSSSAASSSTSVHASSSSSSSFSSSSSTGDSSSSTGSSSGFSSTSVSSSTGIDSSTLASSTGHGNSSSTGVFVAAAISIPKDNTTLFLITGGCVGVGVSIIVGLFACFCQRRNRANEQAKKKLEDIRKLEQEKVKAKKSKRNLNKKNGGDAAGQGQGELADSGPVPFPLEREEIKDEQEGEDQGSPLLGEGGNSGEARIDMGENLSGETDFPLETNDGFDGLAPTSFANASNDRKRTDLSLANEAAIKARKRQERMRRKEKQRLKELGEQVSSDEDHSPVGDSDFDSEEDDMKYNRYDHITIEMQGGEAEQGGLTGETTLALNSDYSNLVYDPSATAAAAEELARLTGQTLEEVHQMLAAQQQDEIAAGGAAGLQGLQDDVELYVAAGGSTVIHYSDPAAESNASFSYDDIPPIPHEVTRTYDDSLLAYHGALDSDPYLLSIYSPSHAASPSHVPPTEPLHPRKLPYRVVDTQYSRPLPPAAWRLAHGRSPWGETISFALGHMPRWWQYHKGLDVSETKEEIRRIQLAAKKVAQRKKHARNASLGMPMMMKPASISTSSRNHIKSIAGTSTSYGSSSTPSSSHPSIHAASSLSVKSSLRPSRLQSPDHPTRSALHELVRDASPSPSEPLASPSGYGLASPSIAEEEAPPPLPTMMGMGDMTDRSHRRDDERRGGGSSSHYRYGEDEELSLMGSGSGDGSSTYRGYSSFQPMGVEKPQREGERNQQLWRLDG